MNRRFEMVDVFGSGPVSGNPLAVVVDSAELDTDEMLRITKWFNLSETAFLLPPTTSDADYRVRIFTLRGELPFAGHPTLGSCHVWLGQNPHHDGDQVVQECGAGLVSIKRDGRLSFAAPDQTRSGPVDADYLSSVMSVLGVEPSDLVAAEWVDNGPGWVGLLLNDRETVLRLTPDASRWDRDDEMDIGVAAIHDGDDFDLEVRGFFRDSNGQLAEDPVTGSLNASLAQWLIGTNRLRSPYVAAQGTALGRSGRVSLVEDADGQVWVGGRTETVVSGDLTV